MYAGGHAKTIQKSALCPRRANGLVIMVRWNSPAHWLMKAHAKTNGNSRPRTRAVPGEIFVVIYYLLFSAFWVLLSDRVVLLVAKDPAHEARLQTTKGLAFITATAVLLYWLLYRSFRKRERAVSLAHDACERFELVARASNDAIWDWDLATNEIWWSEGFKELFGYAREELEPTIESWTKRLHPDDLDRAVAGLHGVIESGGHLWYDEYRFRRKDGKYAYVYDRGFVIHNGKGKPVRMVGGMTDVTAKKEAEEQVELSRRQMRALSARLESLREEERTRISREIHDELGQMLTGLKMDLRWVENRLAKLDGAVADLNPVVDKVVGASELADQTLNRVQNIAAELRPGVLDNLGLAMAIKYEAKRFEDRTGIRCKVNLPESPPDMKAEVETAIFRILQEALTNVTRHSQATEAQIDFCLQGDDVFLELRDNGKGISADALANPRSIGLVGMRERALLLGGEIKFESLSSGGTLVTLRIPECANDTKFWELV